MTSQSTEGQFGQCPEVSGKGTRIILAYIFGLQEERPSRDVWSKRFLAQVLRGRYGLKLQEAELLYRGGDRAHPRACESQSSTRGCLLLLLPVSPVVLAGEKCPEAFTEA